MGDRPHVVVVGGGVTGLTTAYSLLQEDTAGSSPSVTVMEAGRRLGGKLHTIEVDGLPVEAGADSFVVRKPWAVDLCRDLGLEQELVVPGASKAYVWAGGVLRPFIQPSAFGVPARAGDLLRWEGLAMRDRMRALLDLFLRRGSGDSDEVLGSLLRRRLGVAASATLVEPLLAGLHAGDPARMSTAATFPELMAWDRNHGSLIRGSRAAAKASREARGAIFATVWGGLGRMVSALAAALGDKRVRMDAPVTAIEQSGREFIVESGDERLEADAVVLATPAFEAARLLAPLSPAASGDLAGVRYASTAAAVLVYPPGTAGALPDGTGFVVPAESQQTITACTWLSRKWPVPEFGDRAIIRCFVGRDGREEALDLTDDQLTEAVDADVQRATPIGAGPAAARVVRWARGMPQYDVGHLDRVDRIERALEQVPGMFVAGSAYRGVGIADCVRQANEIATEVRKFVGFQTLDGGRSRTQEVSKWGR